MSSPDDNSDVAALRRCIGDVVALSALSAVWATASRETIAQSLSAVIHDALGSDLTFVGLRESGDGHAYEAFTPRPDNASLAEAIRAQLTGWLREPDVSRALPALIGIPPHVVSPIGIHGEHGVIVAVVSRSGFPSETDRLQLNVAGNQATQALLTARAREEQRIADTLQGIGIAMAAELDTEKVIQGVTDRATALTGADFGAFFYNVENAAGESYMLYTLAGAPREAFSKFAMPRNTAIFGPTFAGAGVVRLSDVTKDPRYGHNPPHHGMPKGHLPVRSYLAVPVLSRTGKVHGGLFLGHKDVGVFTERHERLASGVAAWAALALDNGALYAEAQRANRAKDEFLATLSHELRTPLNAIVGWLSMVRSPDKMAPGGAPKAWAAVDRNTQALTELVEDLLDVSRIATGKVRLADAVLDLNDVVRDGVRTIEPKLVEKGLALSAEIDPDPCAIRGDEARLRQVIGNLLSNAVKFTARGGQITVVSTCRDGDAVLVVEDTGIGIHPDFLPHVFQRFRQGDTDAASGLGLGLAIVKNLVELHGGAVAAASDGIGRGARFTVTLPRLTDA